MAEKSANRDIESIPDSKDIFDKFLESKGHEVDEDWISDHNKKKCPECFSLHTQDAEKCSTCGWSKS